MPWINFVLQPPETLDPVSFASLAKMEGSIKQRAYLHVSNRHWISAGVTNLFQSCVPFGTSFKTCSAAMIPPSQAGNVLFNVVRKIEPPGSSVSTQHYKFKYTNVYRFPCLSPSTCYTFRNSSLSSTCSTTSDAITALYVSLLSGEKFSITVWI